VQEALADTRVVLINGARQVGKSTLARQVSQGYAADYRTLDDPVLWETAVTDPVSFVRSDHLLVIDEIQRDPRLFLPIKQVVDLNPQPGQFLLTGSARVLGLRGLPDALPGRMETVELWPFSQGEIDGESDGFVDWVFGQPDLPAQRSSFSRADYFDRLTRGGFPEAVSRSVGRRRVFLDNYVDTLINRDVMQLSEIERRPQLRALLKMVAARSGQLLVPNSLANDLGLPRSTVDRYLSLFEEVFLVKRIPSWSRKVDARATSQTKVALVDSGVAANLLDQDATALTALGSALAGGLLEGFVAMEIARQLTWADVRASMYHYRTRDGVEVDIILEDRRNRVVAIEIKASATVTAADFRGIDHLGKRIGDDLHAGVVLYTGERPVSFGPGRWALPISTLWQIEPISRGI
jgi:predicted AAA+ superfamily ATPase